MALSFDQTKSILSDLCVCPNKKLGQNFLVDPRIVEHSILWANVTSEDFIVEVGPGCGTLTRALINTGAKIFAVEKDFSLYQYISKNFPINILHDDALASPVGNFHLQTSYKIVANLPYAIASIWLDKILELSQIPDCMVLLVQKEAADRWLAPSGNKNFCALGINLQAAYTLANKIPVSKRCFHPQPNVDSTLIHLQKRPDFFLFPKPFKQFMREIFIHRRQQIGRCCRENKAIFAEKFQNYLHENHIDEKARAETIPLNHWINASKQIFSNLP